MKEVIRARDLVRLVPLRDLLESEGIRTFIRNEFMGNVEPIPIFDPVLCVVDVADFDRAKDLVAQRQREVHSTTDIEKDCPACGVPNPEHFDICWDCGADMG